jgi:hypothetical protein
MRSMDRKGFEGTCALERSEGNKVLHHVDPSLVSPLNSQPCAIMKSEIWIDVKAAQVPRSSDESTDWTLA